MASCSSILSRSLQSSSQVDLSVKLNVQNQGGFVFDYRGAGDFKFVAIDVPTDRTLIGHYTTAEDRVVDAQMTKKINPGTDYTLGVSLQGALVNVSFNRKLELGHDYSSVTVDGQVGQFSRTAGASFDNFSVKCDDASFLLADAMMASMAGGGAATLSGEQLDAMVADAIALWETALGANDPRLKSLGSVSVVLSDLPGQMLGYSSGSLVTIDTDAAGLGWFVDVSSADGVEFSIEVDVHSLRAGAGSEAFGRVDLLTVVMHELGHVLGLEHGDAGIHGVMHQELDPGVRFLLDDLGFDDDPNVPVSDHTLLRLAVQAAEFEAQSKSGGIGRQVPSFDLDFASGETGGAGIDWQARSEGG